MNRDSYLNFLKKFKISDNDFIEYGLKDIIFISKDKANIEWEILKKKVYSNQEVYIRGMGRDAASTKYMFEIHSSLFDNSNIIFVAFAATTLPSKKIKSPMNRIGFLPNRSER